MKERFSFNVARIHEVVYAPLDDVSLVNRIAGESPPGWAGLCNPALVWNGPSWETCLLNRDPMLFQHIAPKSFMRLGWKDILLALSNAAFHLQNSGYQAWYRVISIIAGKEVFEALNV